MFSVLISEKGGAERREDFDQSELTIGRIQGNDLMLPKGNVSKRHARIVYRDGRYIVTDLNSTNGTYVNRRRINQATIVRPGDRIYVGDFILKIDAPEELSIDSSSPPHERSQVGSSPGNTVASPAPKRRSDFPSIGPEADVTGSMQYPAVPPAPRVPGRSVDSGLSPLPSSTPNVGSERISTREDSIPGDLVAFRAATRALVERVESRVGARLLEGELTPATRERVSQAIEQELGSLRSDGTIPAAVIEEPLKRDVRAELCELGPLGPLIEDVGVSEIAVTGVHEVGFVRGGHRTRAEPPLSSAASLRRIVARLCRRAGAPLGTKETVVERTLPQGFRLRAVVGDAVDGALIRLERARKVETTLDDLVRQGTVSRAIATFLRQCAQARVNVLVAGAPESRTNSVLSALAAASGSGPVLVVQHMDEFAVPGLKVTHVRERSGQEAVAAAVDLCPSLPGVRLVVERFAGETARAALGAIAGGARGVLGAIPAPNARRGLGLVAGELAASQQGVGVETYRSWLAVAFDLYIEVATLRDGRHRVVRISEPTVVVGDEIQTQEIFAFLVERTATGGAVEGTFHATGTQPRIVDDMMARGISVDRSLFKRTSG